MFLLENESKQILEQYGIKVPRGRVIFSAGAAEPAAAELNGAVALKALVASGGRGKQGGIRFAGTPSGAAEEAEKLFGMELAGEKVSAVLVEEKLTIRKELYLGVAIDLSESRPLVIFSREGGVDIEKAGRSIDKYYLDVLQPVEKHRLVEFLKQGGLNGKFLGEAAGILDRLINVFLNYDCLTVEINPLVITGNEELIAADAKIVVDDSAYFRQNSLPWERVDQTLHPLEREAAAAGLSLVLLSGKGDIGLICGGAGLGLATMDIVAHYGGETANFLDTGGGLSVEKMAKALEIVLKVPSLKGVLINVFGGINSCLNVARGIADVIGRENRDSGTAPIVVRMQGHFQEEGWALLEQYERVSLVKDGDIDDAVQKIISIIREGNRPEQSGSS